MGNVFLKLYLKIKVIYKNCINNASYTLKVQEILDLTTL